LQHTEIQVEVLLAVNPMIDLNELAVASVEDLIKKRRQLAEGLAILDMLIRHIGSRKGRDHPGTQGVGP
jgi:hypothetical protein